MTSYNKHKSMILQIAQIITAILLIAAILLQMQGAGLGGAFGGGGEFYRSKRSIEKFLFWFTGVLVILFAVFSILLLILPH